MKKTVLMVNLLGLLALGYLLYANYMNLFLDPVVTYTDTSNHASSILSLPVVVGFLAAISLILVFISDLYWLISSNK